MLPIYNCVMSTWLRIWVYNLDVEFKISTVIISSHLPDFISYLMSHRSFLLGHKHSLLCTNTTTEWVSTIGDTQEPLLV